MRSPAECPCEADGQRSRGGSTSKRERMIAATPSPIRYSRTLPLRWLRSYVQPCILSKIVRSSSVRFNAIDAQVRSKYDALRISNCDAKCIT